MATVSQALAAPKHGGEPLDSKGATNGIAGLAAKATDRLAQSPEHELTMDSLQKLMQAHSTRPLHSRHTDPWKSNRKSESVSSFRGRARRDGPKSCGVGRLRSLSAAEERPGQLAQAILHSHAQLTVDVTSFEVHELEDVLSTCPPKKSTGADGITYEALQPFCARTWQMRSLTCSMKFC